MSTLGDPLTDLGLLVMYSMPLGMPDSPVSTTAAAPRATRTPAELIERYAARSGRDVSAVSWYTAFAWFKLAVILEGIHYRYTLGQTVGARLRPHRRPRPRLHRARPHHPPGRLRRLIRMDFAFDARTEELRAKLLAFMDEYVYPAEAVAEEQRARLASPWDTPAVVEELKAEARRQGLWNLFLPDAEYGAGLTNLQYAPLAEITGRSPQLAPTALNCAAPDTGNMEVLTQFGDEQQKKQWLEPLLAGEIRSAFAMTEPEVASSDATNITTRIERDGDDYVITGRKWYISGAMNPDCKIFIVMGKTDPDGADIRRQQSMILVPRDTPGVEVQRAMQVFGYEDHSHGGHAEVVFDEARVPAVEPDRRGGRRLRHRPGPARPGPDPPLHAADRHGRAGDRADVPPGGVP